MRAGAAHLVLERPIDIGALGIVPIGRPIVTQPIVRRIAVTDARQSGGRYRVEIDRSLYGTINGGGPEFELRSFNGNVYLRRGN
jgi:hypothetical protein